MNINISTQKLWKISIGAFGVLILAFARPTAAHVKWFTNFSFLDQPLGLGQIFSPTYLGLVALSTVVIGSMVVIDRRLDGISWYGKFNEWLSNQQKFSVLVMRVAMAAVLLISWASEAVLTPELATNLAWLEWLQFVLAILLLFPRTTSLAGGGLLLLFGVSLVEFGVFHMLDYVHYIGIGIYLLTSQSTNERIKGIGLPALYATIGFSLIWLGYEKLFYPSWALYLLEQNPQLALGLPAEFFLQGAAFVEISLGYLLIIGLLERPLAATITLVFFMTTLVFGRVEVIGHTPLHAALIVFLFNGAGNIYKPPIAIHKNINWRVAFAAVNFLIAVGLFAVGYSYSAQRQFSLANTAGVNAAGEAMFDLSGHTQLPEITTLMVVEEAPGSFNLRLETQNWVFNPAFVGGPAVANEGYGIVYIDGEEVGRMYDEWYYLGELDPGEYHVVVTLSANNHNPFVYEGEILGAEAAVVVDID